MTARQKVTGRLGLPVDATVGQIVGELDRRLAAGRDSLVAAAARDGRIADTAANRAEWRKILDEPGGELALASLARVAVDPQEPADLVWPWPAVGDVRVPASLVVPAVKPSVPADTAEAVWRFEAQGVTGS